MVIILKSTFIFMGFRCVQIFDANRIAPDGTPRFAASYMGLFCLPMSHNRDELKYLQQYFKHPDNVFLSYHHIKTQHTLSVCALHQQYGEYFFVQGYNPVDPDCIRI